MVTEGVQCPFSENFVCNLLTYCTVQTSPNYQFKPARGHRTQTAAIVIVDVLEGDGCPVFVVDGMEKVDDAQVKENEAYWLKNIEFAGMAAKIQGTSADRNWTDEVSPVLGGKCRRLGKYPSEVH